MFGPSPPLCSLKRKVFVMKTAVYIVGLMIVCGVAVPTHAVSQQGDEPVKWNFTTVRLNDQEARIFFTANIAPGWYIYSQFIKSHCVMPTTFQFMPDQTYELKGEVREESTPLTGCNNFFGIDLARYITSAVFSQDISMITTNTTIKGKIAFMGCSDNRCLLPQEIEFSLDVRRN
jgi:hypothetical protein